MDLKKKTLKGIIWSFVQKWFGQVISTSVFLLLARLLGPEAFGLTAMVSVFMAFMQTFLDQGFAQAIVQREDLEAEHLDTAFWISIIIGLVLTIITVISAGSIANFFGEIQLESMIRWISLNILLISLQSVQTAILRRQFEFKALAVRSLLATSISGLVSLVMAFQGFGVWSLVAQQLVNQFVLCLMLWCVSDWRPGFQISLKHCHELFTFGINIMGLNVVRFFNRRSDDILIGYFLGSEALGYYAVAYRLLLVMINLLTSSTTQVALPAFARLQNDKERLRHAFYRATQLTSVLAFPAFLGIVVLAPELVKTLFGDQWLPSVPVMQVLALSGILHSVSYFNITIINAMGRPSWSLLISSTTAFFNVIGFLVFVRFGILAVAIAFVANEYLLSPASIWAVRKLIQIRIDEYLSHYLAPLIASSTMVFSIITARHFIGSYLELSILIGIYSLLGAVVYVTTIFLLDRNLFKRIMDILNYFIVPNKNKLGKKEMM